MTRFKKSTVFQYILILCVITACQAPVNNEVPEGPEAPSSNTTQDDTPLDTLTRDKILSSAEDYLPDEALQYFDESRGDFDIEACLEDGNDETKCSHWETEAIISVMEVLKHN